MRRRICRTLLAFVLIFGLTVPPCAFAATNYTVKVTLTQNGGDTVQAATGYLDLNEKLVPCVYALVDSNIRAMGDRFSDTGFYDRIISPGYTAYTSTDKVWSDYVDRSFGTDNAIRNDVRYKNQNDDFAAALSDKNNTVRVLQDYGNKVTGCFRSNIADTDQDHIYCVCVELVIGSTGGGGGAGGGVVTYEVDVTASENGTVKADRTSASGGDRVTLTLIPDEGFAVDTLTVKDAGGSDVATSKQSETVYTFIMPESRATVAVTFRETGEAVLSALPFADVETGDWFHDAVAFVYEKGLMTGVSDTMFAPADGTTRAMVVTILWRMAGSPVVDYALPFTDVEEGRWYTDAIRWAAGTGVVTGVSEVDFAPDAQVTREALTTMIYRFEQSLGKGFVGAWVFLLPQNDAGTVSDWADEAVRWCVMNGVINGDDQNNLNPRKTATRGEIATIFMNLDRLEG